MKTQLTKTKQKHRSRRLRRFTRANEAVSALEYAILVGVIAIAVGAALTVFGGKLETAVTNVGDNVIEKHKRAGKKKIY